MKKIWIAGVAFAALLMMPGIARAHDNDKTVLGTVSSISGMACLSDSLPPISTT